MIFSIGNIKIKANTIVAILFISIIMSAATVFSYVRVPRIYLCGLIGILYILKHRNQQKQIFNNKIGRLCLLWIIFLVINVLNSYDITSSIYMLLVLISFFAFMAYDLKINTLIFGCQLIQGISIVFAFSIILNALIPNLFYGPAHFLIAQSANVIQQEVQQGIYSGLMGEKAQAAFYMNIAITFHIGMMIGKNKRYHIKNLFPLLIYFLALLLTGKRMLLLVAVCIFAFSFVCMDLKKRSTFKNLLIVICVGLPTILMFIQLLPQTQIVFNRFAEFASDNTYNGRTVFWQFCLYMFSQRPLIGFGINSFNSALGTLTSFSYHGEKWTMYAHSIYYELLGEAGIIGCMIFFSIIIVSFVTSWKNYKYFNIMTGAFYRYECKMLMFISMAVQIIFCLYGITGNVLYDHCQLGFLILSFIFTINVSRYKKKLQESRIDCEPRLLNNGTSSN